VDEITIYFVRHWQVALAALSLLLLVTELGFRLGHRDPHPGRGPGPAAASIGPR